MLYSTGERERSVDGATTRVVVFHGRSRCFSVAAGVVVFDGRSLGVSVLTEVVSRVVEVDVVVDELVVTAAEEVAGVVHVHISAGSFRVGWL